MELVNRHQPEARRHHFVPQCWLAGFTEKGEHNDRLWVTDFKRQSQWPSSPKNTGFIKDYYRIKRPSIDALAIEKIFGRIESFAAPTLRRIDRELPPMLSSEELADLLQLVAFQFVRVPSFEPYARNALNHAKERFSQSVASPEAWAQQILERRRSHDALEVDYEKAKSYIASLPWGEDQIQDLCMESALRSVGLIVHELRKRCWWLATSNRGILIASDNPVLLYDSRKIRVGFRTAELVAFPISRHVFLLGALDDPEPQVENYKFFACLNTLTLLRAESQVYSHTKDFVFLDELGKVRDNWRLFSKENFIRSS